MRLIATCKTCTSEISFHSLAGDRFALAKRKGEEIELGCSKCGVKHAYHVNEIKAESSRLFLLTAGIILVFACAALIWFVWDYAWKITDPWAVANIVGVIGVPSIIYMNLNKNQEEKVRYFNSKIYG